MRIVITGPPKSGKTTLAEVLGMILSIPVYHTDSVMDLEWSAASQEVSTWFDRDPDWIIEGVTVPRAIRKWRARNPTVRPPPFERLVLIRDPKVSLIKTGQTNMAKTLLDLIEEFKPWIGDKWVEL